MSKSQFAPPASSLEETKEANPRRVWIAMGLGALCPGLGHLYTGSRVLAYSVAVGFLIIRPMLAVLLSVGLLSVLSYGIGTTVGIGLWVAQPPLRHGDIVQYADYLDAASGHYNLAFSRVLALEGETIEAKQGVWRRNGWVIETINLGELMIPGGARSHSPLRGVRFERTEGGRSYWVMRDSDWQKFEPADSFGPVKVPPGHVYLIGDHLDRAYDSRAFGSIRAKHIVGRVVPMRTFAER